MGNNAGTRRNRAPERLQNRLNSLQAAATANDGSVSESGFTRAFKIVAGVMAAYLAIQGIRNLSTGSGNPFAPRSEFERELSRWKGGLSERDRTLVNTYARSFEDMITRLRGRRDPRAVSEEAERVLAFVRLFINT